MNRTHSTRWFMTKLYVILIHIYLISRRHSSVQLCFNVIVFQEKFKCSIVVSNASSMNVSVYCTTRYTLPLAVRNIDKITCSGLNLFSTIMRSIFRLHIGFSFNFRPLVSSSIISPRLYLRIIFGTVLLWSWKYAPKHCTFIVWP